MIDTKTLLWITLVWAVAAYLIVPRLWALYFRRHPILANLARVTQTSDGHPGDPINVSIIGSDAEIVRAMTTAGWFPADPITLASSVRIAADTVLHRSDDDAPVSNLFLFAANRTSPSSNPSEAARASGIMYASGVGASCIRAGPLGSAPRHTTTLSASATPPARSPITSVPMWMPSATASATSCSRRGWWSRLNGTTASIQRLKGGTAAAIPGTPMVA